MAAKTSLRNNLKDDLANIMAAAADSACHSHDEVESAIRKIFSRKNASRMVDGVVFDVDQTLDQKISEIVIELTEYLGPTVGDEAYIYRSLWKSVSKMVIDGALSVKETADNFITDIKSQVNIGRRYIAPNALVVMSKEIHCFEVGPVKIVEGALVARDLNAHRLNDTYLVEARGPGIETRGNMISVGIADNCWEITAIAARENLAEEAAWLAGIATSLLRLAAGPSLGHFGCRLGLTEPHPFQLSTGPNGAITVDEDGVAMDGSATPTQYVISAQTVAYCESVEFKTIVSHLFASNRNSLGRRVLQGLGWLARGRQSEDRAERFLFFFTAIEALLSSDDKTAPVVQTLARHVASILTDDHACRAKIAKLVKDLYEYRSSLVHRGVRVVSKTKANTAENVADRLFLRVLDKCDLGQPVQLFQKGLLASSYGLPWGDEVTHRLGSLDGDGDKA